MLPSSVRPVGPTTGAEVLWRNVIVRPPPALPPEEEQERRIRLLPPARPAQAPPRLQTGPTLPREAPTQATPRGVEGDPLCAGLLMRRRSLNQLLFIYCLYRIPLGRYSSPFGFAVLYIAALSPISLFFLPPGKGRPCEGKSQARERLRRSSRARAKSAAAPAPEPQPPPRTPSPRGVARASFESADSRKPSPTARTI